MPEKWRQYSFDREGRGIEDGSYALENVKVTFDAPSVKVEIPSDQLLGPEAFRALVPQYGDPARKARRVTVKLPYHLRGIVPSLGPLPVVEHAALGDKVIPTFWGKHTLVRYVTTKGFDAELELTTFVSTDECEKNKVQLSAAIQIQGEDPHWVHFQLITVPKGNDQLSRLRQAVRQAGFARITLETPTGFTAYSAAQDALDGSSVTVVEFASPAAVEAHLRRSFGPELSEVARRSLGSLFQFGTSVTARRWYPSKEAEYFNLYTRQTVGGRVYGFGFIEYALVLNGTILLDLLKVFPAPETAPVSKMEIEEQGEAAMRKLAAELVTLGPPNASAFTLKPLSPGVAPKIASKPPASTTRPKVVPKRVPEPSTLPRTGTKAGKIPLPPMPKQDKDLPPLGSVGHVVAENFGTYARIREGKLVLTDVVRGSRGEDVGLSSGDRILQIGDKSLEGLTSAELQALAHAPLRAPLTVTFVRGRDQAQVVVMFLERTSGYTMIVTVIPKR
ncbi:hypothetical protein [Armatimonas sp.]|uniref:hypothetical protein n=1 Tax=Armatimonas sp. TaxID=1872638 RepID=UPI00374DB270